MDEVLVKQAIEELKALREQIAVLVKALQQFASCDLNDANYAPWQVANQRIKKIAREALEKVK
jgi:hypothetical protein